MISIAKPMLGNEEKTAVMKVLDSGWLVQGPMVKEFEEAFARYCGTKHAIATSSGTTALQITYPALGIGPGDEVITTPFTFIASANSIRFSGATPVFADIDPENFNLDPAKIEDKITPRTKAIMPVHLYGNPADMTGINRIAKANGLEVIEDSAQAHGSEVSGKKCGSLGKAGCFSFYPSKNMTTGEGGIITTNDDNTAEMLSLLRSHGQTGPYVHKYLGYNYRLTEMAAAIGIEQLKKLEGFNKKRIENARILSDLLERVDGLCLPSVKKSTRHVFHLYTVRILNGKRDEVQQKMKNLGVDTRVFYPVPIHLQKIYESGETFPEAEKAAKEVLSLPVHPGLTQEETEKIASSLKSVL